MSEPSQRRSREGDERVLLWVGRYWPLGLALLGVLTVGMLWGRWAIVVVIIAIVATKRMPGLDLPHRLTGRIRYLDGMPYRLAFKFYGVTRARRLVGPRQSVSVRYSSDAHRESLTFKPPFGVDVAKWEAAAQELASRHGAAAGRVEKGGGASTALLTIRLLRGGAFDDVEAIDPFEG